MKNNAVIAIVGLEFYTISGKGYFRQLTQDSIGGKKQNNGVGKVEEIFGELPRSEAAREFVFTGRQQNVLKPIQHI